MSARACAFGCGTPMPRSFERTCTVCQAARVLHYLCAIYLRGLTPAEALRELWPSKEAK